MADDFNVSNDTDETVCDIYDSYPYVIVSVVHSVSATVSALCCIFVIIVILLLKKNNFFIQRLIIYHCISTLVNSFGLILLLHRLGNPDSKATEVLCIISGFLYQLSLWYMSLDLVVITFVLLLMGVFNKNVARLEGLYIVFIFIFPLTFNWIPFINNSYGRFEALCWIRNLNNENCTEYDFGSILITALANAPLYLITAVMAPIYIVAAVFLTKQKYCNRQKSETITAAEYEARALQKNLQEELWPLALLTIGVLAFTAFPAANRIHSIIDPNNPSLALAMLRAIFSPLQGAYIALVYLLDRETIKRRKYSNIKAAIKQRNVIMEYPIEDSEATISRHRLLVSPYNEYNMSATNPVSSDLTLDQSF